jgi:hypothetical protein
MDSLIKVGQPLYTSKMLTVKEQQEDLYRSFYCRMYRTGFSMLPLFPRNTYKVIHGKYELTVEIPMGEYWRVKPEIMEWLKAVCLLGGHKAQKNPYDENRE